MRLIKVSTGNKDRLVGHEEATTLLLKYVVTKESRFAEVLIEAYCRDKADNLFAVHQWKFPGIGEDAEISVSFTTSGTPSVPDKSNHRQSHRTRDETKIIEDGIEKAKQENRKLENIIREISSGVIVTNKYTASRCCSFCGKTQSEVKQLIAGSTGFICGECVILCNKIVESGGYSD